MVADSFYRSFGTPVATVRPFNTYGPRQSARAVIPTIISQALNSSREEIRLGTLTPVRDLSFVKDTVQGFISIAQSDEAVGQITNLGAGKGITIGDLAAKILQVAGIDKPIVHDKGRDRPANSEVLELLADSTKARTLFNWQPRYSLAEGLAETIEFVRQHPNFFKSGHYAV
jgi:nucleoside-diphosphate-sugar epimerase